MRVCKRSVPALIAVIAVAVVLGSVARAEVTPPAGVNAGAPIWGGTIQFTDAMAADIASAGCKAIRLNFRLDGNSTWTTAHLAKYDTIVQTARSHNLQILGLIANEAVYGTQSDWNQNYNTTGLNSYVYTFADNAWLLINRYKNNIKVFEIWNEPDCWSVDPNTNPLNPGGFYIWPKNYACVLTETYKKCITSGGASFFTANGVSLSTGGLFAHDIGGSFSTSRAYMTSVYDQTSIWNSFQSVAGRRYPWNYFGYHFYLNMGSAVSTSELQSYFGDIRQMKTAYSDATPFLVTEFGWQSTAVGEQLQAANLRDTYNWMRTQTDIVTGYWYQWNDDQGYGLVYSVGNHKAAYAEFAKQCVSLVPVAGFQGTPLSGFSPLTVQFTDQSTGTITSRLWDFGDGTTSTQANPAHVYQAVGAYTLRLTVANASGSDTGIAGNYVTVRNYPCDMNDDRHVDQTDFGLFQACMTDMPQNAPACQRAKLTNDEYVDQQDVSVFLGCMTGPGGQPNPSCAE
jgi:PKD repeat protein